MKLGIRQIISLVAMFLLGFIIVFCLMTGKDIPDSLNAIITAFIGYIGYYFGKSTALDTPKNIEKE